ncbi:MAG: hypothetical protein GY805_36355 [Chloroflexi bacterium]|nr:hypothetical protein [Chloroflexota bacterium]
MSKKQLGFLFIGIGSVGIAALFAVDLLRATQFSGIGPIQRLGLLAAGVLVFVGLTLLPLGDKPA